MFKTHISFLFLINCFTADILTCDSKKNTGVTSRMFEGATIHYISKMTKLNPPR